MEQRFHPVVDFVNTLLLNLDLSADRQVKHFLIILGNSWDAYPCNKPSDFRHYQCHNFYYLTDNAFQLLVAKF